MSAVHTEYTDQEIHHFHVRYFSQLTLYQILTLIQITLILITVIKLRNKDNESNKSTDDSQNINDSLKWLFILVLSLGSLVFILVEWYGIADFLYDFAAFKNYCDIAAILGNLSLMTYLLALYLFYLYRLYATFNGSPFELSPKMTKTLLIITFSVYFAMVISVFIFQKGAVKHTPFAWNLQPSDYKWIIICEGEFSIGINPMLRIALQCIVIIGNTYYGWLFYKKCRELLAVINALRSDKDIDGLSEICKLINKQTTLIMVSTVSTSMLWSVVNILHYFGSFLQVLIYFDITINCLCLFLTFSWNDKLYKRYCTPCALLNGICCSVKHIETAMSLNEIVEIKNNHTKSDNSLNVNQCQHQSETGCNVNQSEQNVLIYENVKNTKECYHE
eukprot:330199_1